MKIRCSLIILGFVALFSLASVKCSKKIKNQRTAEKSVKNGDLKKVSSSKVPNDGRKGPTSGNIAGNMPISPVVISFPFPKKGKSSKSKSKSKAKLKKDEKTNKKERRGNKQPRASEAHPAATLKKEERRETHEAEEFLAVDEVVQRMRREVDEDDFSEEEKRLRDDWLKMDEEVHEGNIPSRETASFVPPNLRYIYETDAYNELFEPQQESESLLRNKRSLSTSEEEGEEIDTERQQPGEGEEEEDFMSQNEQLPSRVIEKRDVTDYDFNDEFMSEDIARDMRTRDISLENEYGDDVMDVIEDSPGGFMEPIRHTIVTRDAPSNDVQTKENVEKAVKAMDKIMEGLGINEDTIIEQTHECLKQSINDRRTFDQRFRRHIVHARDLLDEPVQRRGEITALKRSLESDQEELKDINERLSLCKENIMSVLRIKAAEYSAQVRSIGGSFTTSTIDDVSQQRSAGNSLDSATASFSELKTQTVPMIPSAMLKPQQQELSPPAAPMFTTITLRPASQPVAQPVVQPEPIAASFMRPVIQQQQYDSHEIGMQRHFDSAPNPLNSIRQQQQQASVMYQPHIESHLQPSMFKYYQQQQRQQPQPLAFNRLASYPGEMVRQSYQMSRQEPFLAEQYHGVREQPNVPSFNYFRERQPAVLSRPAALRPGQMTGVYNAFRQNQFFAQPQKPLQIQPSYAVQQHTLSKPLSFYQEGFPAPVPIVASYASNKAGKPKLSDPDHHHSSTDSDANNDGKDDWSSSLWFPGTTYSPPPSWIQGQKVHESSRNPFALNQPLQQDQQQQQHQQQQSYKPAIVPFSNNAAQRQDEHPLITQIAGEVGHTEGEPGVVAPFSSLKPYNPFTQQQHQMMPVVVQQQQIPSSIPFMGIPVQNSASPAVFPFASPQNSAHEIIKAGPQTEVQTINKEQPPADKPKEDGDLPGYLGALDVAKYPFDSTDRLRGKDEKKDNGKQKDEEQAPKREHVINSKSPEDIKVAVKSVNNIGTNIGLSEKDLNKLVDEVSGNVRKVRQLCEQLVKKDEDLMKKHCNAAARNTESATTSSNSAQKSELDKRSEIKSDICTNIRMKRDKDQTCMASSQETLNEVNQIEGTALGIEVAKWAAQSGGQVIQLAQAQ